MRHTQTQGRITYIDICLGKTIILWGVQILDEEHVSLSVKRKD